MVNECIRQAKKAMRLGDLKEDFDKATEDTPTLWEVVSLQLLHEEIKALPDGCRQVFVLYAMEDFSHRDVAANLGITEGTSKS